MNACTYSLIPYFLALKGIVKKYGSLSNNIVKMTQTLNTKMAHCDDASCFLFYVQRTFLKYRDFLIPMSKFTLLQLTELPFSGKRYILYAKRKRTKNQLNCKTNTRLRRGKIRERVCNFSVKANP